MSVTKQPLRCNTAGRFAGCRLSARLGTSRSEASRRKLLHQTYYQDEKMKNLCQTFQQGENWRSKFVIHSPLLHRSLIAVNSQSFKCLVATEHSGTYWKPMEIKMAVSQVLFKIEGWCSLDRKGFGSSSHFFAGNSPQQPDANGSTSGSVQDWCLVHERSLNTLSFEKGSVKEQDGASHPQLPLSTASLVFAKQLQRHLWTPLHKPGK